MRAGVWSREGVLCRRQAHPESLPPGWLPYGGLGGLCGVCSAEGMTADLSPAWPRRPLEAARLDRVPEDLLLPVTVLGGAEPPAGFQLHQGRGVQRGAGDRGLTAHVRHPQDQQGECLQARPHPKLQNPCPRALTQTPGQTKTNTQADRHENTIHTDAQAPPTHGGTLSAPHTRTCTAWRQRADAVNLSGLEPGQ